MTPALLDTSTVAAYLAGRRDLADRIDASTVSAEEIGDGNLNLVFLARDAGGRSLVLKQSLPHVRSDSSWAVTQDRIFAEARGYSAAGRTAPGFTPQFYGLDDARRLIVIEDLSGWTVWRSALNAGRITAGAASDLGIFVARQAFGTSAFALPAEEFRRAAAAATNPELCRITEDLVFTEPFIDHVHNSWDEELTPLVHSLRTTRIRAAVAELKYAFLTSAESLLHGDLHTGSVFVPGAQASGTAHPEGSPRGPVARAFDLEFGFYGPSAFDLGALFGNYLIAQSRASALGRPDEFQRWVAGLTTETWEAFETEFRRLWRTRGDTSFTDQFLDQWLTRVWHQAVGFGAVKAIRRVVGWAKVSDLETLDHGDRVRAAGATLTAARDWLEGQQQITDATELATVTAVAVRERVR